MTPSNRLKSPQVTLLFITTAFAVLPDFGFLTLGGDGRRRATREWNGALNGLRGQVAMSAGVRGNPRNSAGPRKKKG
jgi:hypothetical protein